MTVESQIGAIGEEEAVLFLREKGHQILQTNWRYRHLEVDIITFHDNILVFFEVKSRTSPLFGLPESFVGRAKQKKIIAAADAYLQLTSTLAEVRFDIISVLLLPQDGLAHLLNQPDNYDFILENDYTLRSVLVNEKNMEAVIRHTENAFTPEW